MTISRAGILVIAALFAVAVALDPALNRRDRLKLVVVIGGLIVIGIWTDDA